MEGQFREVIHTVNNLAQKFEDLMRAVDKSAHLPQLVAENKAAVTALEVRVTALEAQENRRAGAIGLSAWFVKTVPFAALGAGIAVMGKVIGL